MKIGGLEISWKAKDNLENYLAQAVYKFLGTGQVLWYGKNRKEYIDKGYSDNEVVYSVVRVILSKLTEAPLMLYSVKDEKKAKQYKSYLKKGGNGQERIQTLLFQTKALEEVENHPLIELLEKPNDYQTQAEFFESAFGFYKLLGETFIYGIGPGEESVNRGKFTELHVLPAHLVEVVFGNSLEPIRGYKFSLGDQSIEIPAANVLHLKTWNPNWSLNGEQLRGFSPLEAGSKVLTRNNYNKTAQTKQFVNGGTGYLLSSASDTRALTQDQLDLINKRIIDKVKGPDNINTITATSGMVNVTKLGDSLADMKLIEADEADLKRICMIFGVDADIFLNGSTFNNKEGAYKSLVTNVILTDLIRMRDKLNNFLLPAYESEGKYFLDYDTTVYAELQPDLKLMKEVYGNMWQLTPNELRSIFKWDAVDEEYMNKIYIPMGLSELGSLAVTDQEFDKAYRQTGDYE